jgi:hypothetical protein
MYNSIAIRFAKCILFADSSSLRFTVTRNLWTRKTSVFWEGIRFIFGIGLIFYFGDWFGMNQLFPFASYIGGYLVLSLAVTLYFVSIILKRNNDCSSILKRNKAP